MIDNDETNRTTKLEEKKSLFKRPKKTKKKSLAKRKINDLDDDDDDDEDDVKNHEQEESNTTTMTAGASTTAKTSMFTTNGHGDEAGTFDKNSDIHKNHNDSNNDSNNVDVSNKIRIGNLQEDQNLNISKEKSPLSILHKIESIKKARKIKDRIRTRGLDDGSVAIPSLSLRKKIKTGGGSVSLSQQQQQQQQQGEKPVEFSETVANQDLRQRLEGNFSIKARNTTDEEEGSVLMQKHKLAMEEFIQRQMNQSDGANLTQQHDDGNHAHISNKLPSLDHGADEMMTMESEQRHLQVKNANDLYAKILQEATNEIQENTTAEESDVGAGGAMLGGTGIAEVVLPVEERIKAARQTELAAARMKQMHMRKTKRYNYRSSHRGGDYVGDNNHPLDYDHDDDPANVSSQELLPTSFGAGPGKRRQRNQRNQQQQRQQQPEVLAPVFEPEMDESTPSEKILQVQQQEKKNVVPIMSGPSSYSHNFRLHNQEWIHKKKQEERQHSRVQKVQEQKQGQEKYFDNNGNSEHRQHDDMDHDRLGFEAKRKSKGLEGRREAGSGDGKKHIQRAHDDIIYKKFVTREYQNIRR